MVEPIYNVFLPTAVADLQYERDWAVYRCREEEARCREAEAELVVLAASNRELTAELAALQEQMRVSGQAV